MVGAAQSGGGPDLGRRPGRLPGGSDASAKPSILLDSEEGRGTSKLRN